MIKKAFIVKFFAISSLIMLTGFECDTSNAQKLFDDYVNSINAAFSNRPQPTPTPEPPYSDVIRESEIITES